MLFRSLTFVPNVIFWLGEIRVPVAGAGVGSQFTTDKLREPAHALHMYRCIQLIVRLSNELLARLHIHLVHTIAIVVAVASNVLMIRHHVRISLFFVFCFELAVSISFLSYMHIMLGQVSKASVGFIGSWRRNPSVGTGEQKATERRLLLKYIRSCQPLRFEIGSYGSFQRLGALRNLGRIIGYTVKALVTMKFSL